MLINTIMLYSWAESIRNGELSSEGPVCGDPGAVLMGANCTTPECGSSTQITASRLVTTIQLNTSASSTVPTATAHATVPTTVHIRTVHTTVPTRVSISEHASEYISPSTTDLYEMEAQRELLETEQDVVTEVSVTYCI